MRKPINLDGSTMDALVLMSEGNPGGATVLAEMVKHEPDNAALHLVNLDDMNIRGSQIWVGYKDFCGENLELFCQKVKERDPAMIDCINEQCYHPEIDNDAYQHRAVREGAILDRYKSKEENDGT